MLRVTPVIGLLSLLFVSAASGDEPEIHWSFLPIKGVRPAQDTSGWSANGVDRFVIQRLRSQGLQPATEASRRVLIRRLYFDLTGLPPTWEETRDFVADKRPDAWSRLVERLLASPSYGERWGRHWLDLVRYSDTQGGSVDCPIPQARLFRNYVIDAFRADKPYDQFIREQIAGDILAKQGPPQKFRERVIATGFVGLSLRNGIFKHYHPELIIEDTINTIGRSMLGLSIRCARCHDHKHEPISTADYYRLYGIFASSRYPFSGSELPAFSAGESVLVVTPNQWKAIPQQQRDLMQRLRQQIKTTIANHPAQAEMKAKQKRLAGDVARYHAIRQRGEFDPVLRTSIDDQDIRIREVVSKYDNSVRKLWNQLKAVERSVGLERAYAMREEHPHDAHVQVNGDPFDKGPLVKRGVPARLARGKQLQIPRRQSGRLQLAQWLSAPDNPLTPRVAVNYIWQFHFGRGIVHPPDNFGYSGSDPTHPALLDFLAGELIRGGWSIKHVHRLIVLSKTYRMAFSRDPASLAKDPENRWRWRFDRRRLDAESIRDGMMTVSGSLDLRRPGAHPFPDERSWQFSQHGPFRAVYASNHRSVYLMTQRIQRHPFLALFDGPDTNRPTTKRKSSSAALQALYLRNSQFVHKQTNELATSLLQLPNDRRRAVSAVRRIWSRDPAPREVDEAIAYVARYRELMKRECGSSHGAAQLVLEYKFDGNAQDSSGWKRHGKLVGNPKFVKGRWGECISLDGKGDYVRSSTTLNDLGRAFAVECWVRPAPTQAHYADIFGNHLGGGRGFVLQQVGNKTNQFTGSIGSGNNNWTLTPAVTLVAGKWQLLAMVRTPQALQLFLDGKKRVEVLTNVEVAPSPLEFRVGLGITLVERCFHGEIDELRVYRGVPKKYGQVRSTPDPFGKAAWSSYCRILMTSNEFLYVD